MRVRARKPTRAPTAAQPRSTNREPEWRHGQVVPTEQRARRHRVPGVAHLGRRTEALGHQQLQHVARFPGHARHGREPAVGVAEFEAAAGDYWVTARYELPYTELYWNISMSVVRGEPLQVRLMRDNASSRPKL